MNFQRLNEYVDRELAARGSIGLAVWHVIAVLLAAGFLFIEILTYLTRPLEGPRPMYDTAMDVQAIATFINAAVFVLALVLVFAVKRRLLERRIAAALDRWEQLSDGPLATAVGAARDAIARNAAGNTALLLLSSFIAANVTFFWITGPILESHPLFVLNIVPVPVLAAYAVWAFPRHARVKARLMAGGTR